jgi:hypothetical protein
MLHEPRRRRPWLIFDVRRFTMTTIRSHSETMQVVASVPAGRKFWFESVAAASIGRRDIRACRLARFTLSLRLRKVFERCFRASLKELPVLDGEASLFISEGVSSLQSPNKAPEPTSTSVTPRALVPKIECSNRIDRSIAARVVPAVLVAHL